MQFAHFSTRGGKTMSTRAWTTSRTGSTGSEMVRRTTRRLSLATVCHFPRITLDTLLILLSGAWYLSEDYIDRPPGEFHAGFARHLG